MFTLRRVRQSLWLLVVVGLAAQPARGQTIVRPGETLQNIPAVPRVLEVQGNQFADFRSWAEVTFDRADEEAQNIRVVATHPVRYFPVYGTAVARGMLFVDFCVPAADAESGCGAEPAVADIVSATIAFGYGFVGRVSSFGFTSRATFHVTASVLDVPEQRYIQVQELENLSVQGRTVTIKKIPIPLPGLEDATLTRGAAFSLLLRRGRLYRFQFAAAATSTKGLVQSPGSAFFATSDFSGPLPGPGAPVDGFVQLRGLTVSVSPDLSSLLELVASLQEQINRLVEQLDGLRTEHRDDIAALREELAELRMCASSPPGLNWRCVNGGWVPPGQNEGASDGGEPPAEQQGCTGAAPGPDWSCTKGERIRLPLLRRIR
jgi:hypothetical protein